MCKGTGIRLGFLSLENMEAVRDAEAVNSMGTTGTQGEHQGREVPRVSVETGWPQESGLKSIHRPFEGARLSSE